MARRRSAHEVKRALIRRLSSEHPAVVERIVTQLREYSIARRFLHGSSIEWLCRDMDAGGAWEPARIEPAIRNATTTRRQR